MILGCFYCHSIREEGPLFSALAPLRPSYIKNVGLPEQVKSQENIGKQHKWQRNKPHKYPNHLLVLL
jgi:hypothetical protein